MEATVFFQAGGLAFVLWGCENLAADAGTDDDGTDGFGGIVLAHNVRSPAEVDAILSSAAGAGAVITSPASPTSYGGYAGYFADPDGHLWEVATIPASPSATTAACCFRTSVKAEPNLVSGPMKDAVGNPTLVGGGDLLGLDERGWADVRVSSALYSADRLQWPSAGRGIGSSGTPNESWNTVIACSWPASDKPASMMRLTDGARSLWRARTVSATISLAVRFSGAAAAAAAFLLRGFFTGDGIGSSFGLR